MESTLCPNCKHDAPQIRLGGATVDGEAVLRYHCTACARVYHLPAAPEQLAFVLVAHSAFAQAAP